MVYESQKKYYEQHKERLKEKIACDRCGAMVRRGAISKHKKTKKCLSHNDKTAETHSLSSTKIPSLPSGAGLTLPAPSAESHLKEINLKGEFDKMATKLNPKKDEKKGDMKYECGACGQQFNHAASDESGNKICPACGIELEC